MQLVDVLQCRDVLRRDGILQPALDILESLIQRLGRADGGVKPLLDQLELVLVAETDGDADDQNDDESEAGQQR